MIVIVWSYCYNLPSLFEMTLTSIICDIYIHYHGLQQIHRGGLIIRWGEGGGVTISLSFRQYLLSLTFEQNASCPRAHVPQTTFPFVSHWWSAPVHNPGLDPLWSSEKFVISDGA